MINTCILFYFHIMTYHTEHVGEHAVSMELALGVSRKHTYSLYKNPLHRSIIKNGYQCIIQTIAILNTLASWNNIG